MISRISRITAQQIVETVKDVCGQNINYIDKSGTIFASTDKNRIDQYHEIGKQVALTCETLEVYEENKFYGTQPGVNIPIIYQGNLISVIGISGNPDEVRKYGYLAEKITLLLLKEQELNEENNSKKYKINYIIRSMIDAEHANNNNINKYLNEIHIDFSLKYQLILIHLDARYNTKNISIIETSILNTFSQMSVSLFTFNYPNEYVAILDSESLSKNYSTLRKLFYDNKLIMKVSISSAHIITHQYKSYKEAKVAINSFIDSSEIALYDNLGIELLCTNVESDISSLYINKFLSLLDLEEIALLKTYYKNNMSLSQTSSELFLHKNTIQYQLDKIYKKSGYNPRNFKDAVGFYVALIQMQI